MSVSPAVAFRRSVTAVYGNRGAWLYAAFDAINAAWFGGELPTPLITLELTPHGACLGWTQAKLTESPRIAIHPSVFGGTEKENPWRVPAECLGPAFAFDVLLHELMHVSVEYRLGGWTQGESPHDNPQWIGETNRLLPLLGFPRLVAGRRRPTRVPVPGARTKRGKPKTTIRRVDLGDFPFKAAAVFPHGLRLHLGSAAAYYESGYVPLPIAVEKPLSQAG